ncbi:rhodanese-like domain-containing protein [Magnetococcales bacterium HHB-1]
MSSLPAAPLPSPAGTLHQLTPHEAYHLIQKKRAVFIDVRMELEHFFVGHPQGVVNIPWQDAPDFEINPAFVKEVSVVAKKSDHVVLICRSGHRSIEAGNQLIEAGFKYVYNVLEGFEGDRNKEHHRSTINGWRFHKLPWVQC